MGRVGRPPMPIGTLGAIKATELGPKLWEARAKYRDKNGKVRPIRRRGSSKTAATNRLKQDAAELIDEIQSGDLSKDTRLEVVANTWHAAFDLEAKAGAKSRNSARNYRGYLDNHILPVIGELRMHEVTVTRVDAFFKAKRKAGMKYDAAKSMRAVMSTVCQYAVRHGALDSNPVRDIDDLFREESEEKLVVALELEQRKELLSKLEQHAADRQTDSKGRSIGRRGDVWRDLPDIVRAMLATGLRLGELLALAGEDFDPSKREITVRHHIVRHTGEGLVRKRHRKGTKGDLVLRIPEWALPVFRNRKLASGGGMLFSSWNGELLDPSNTINRIRDAFGKIGYGWVTSHVFRKTVAGVLDEANLPTTAIADQLGNTPAVVEVHYRARRAANPGAVAALEGMFGSPGV